MEKDMAWSIELHLPLGDKYLLYVTTELEADHSKLYLWFISIFSTSAH